MPDLFNTDDTVWAYSKPEKGQGYQLNQGEYDMLVVQANNSRTLAGRTKKFLETIKSDLTDGTFLKKDGSLTCAGVFVDHFNLTKSMNYERTSDREVRCRLSGKPKFGFSKIDLELLYRSVCDVVDFTSQGLNGRLIFRGVNESEATNKTAGMIKYRERDGVKEVLSSSNPKRIPKLDRDPVFTNERLASKSDIYLNYILLSDAQKYRPYLTIIHEATHKFARTIDVDAPRSYSVRECRKMHWTLAVRNATHHERFHTVAWQYTKAIDAGRALNEHLVYAST